MNTSISFPIAYLDGVSLSYKYRHILGKCIEIKEKKKEKKEGRKAGGETASMLRYNKQIGLKYSKHILASIYSDKIPRTMCVCCMIKKRRHPPGLEEFHEKSIFTFADDPSACNWASITHRAHSIISHFIVSVEYVSFYFISRTRSVPPRPEWPSKSVFVSIQTKIRSTILWSCSILFL